jgi:hypothetical protein
MGNDLIDETLPEEMIDETLASFHRLVVFFEKLQCIHSFPPSNTKYVLLVIRLLSD